MYIYIYIYTYLRIYCIISIYSSIYWYKPTSTTQVFEKTGLSPC